MRDEIFNRCKLPRTLRETGKVTREQLAQIAELTLDDGAIIINPKEADRAEIMAILEKAW
jgi:alcohol dehydrogenase